ncbi:MAG TPA: glycosyltransferase family 39 protein [Geobacteraceae bacterium]|nr:glycosyltransferase family 39 protein [Geobacteraceae bacterium]
MNRERIGTGFKPDYLPYIVLALILCVVLYVRIRLLHVPLERDEGEYAYMGQLMLKGIAPYGNAYTMKLPGVSFLYALFMMFFGQTVAAIHLGLLLVNGISVFLTYLLAYRLLGREAALLSCATYAVLSLSYSLLGVFAHATHFVVLFALAGFVLLFRHLDRDHTLTLFFSSLCFGLAFIMKQHAALLVGFALCYLLWRSWENPNGSRSKLIARSAVFLFGMIIPYALVILYVFKAGVFDKFWFWTVQYAREYVSEITLRQGWGYFYGNSSRIVIAQLPFCILAGIGGCFLCSKKRIESDRFFILGLFLVSVLAILPGWYFRPHYFIMLLPAVALMAGAVVHPAGLLNSRVMSRSGRKLMLTVLLVTAAGYAFAREKDYFFNHSPRQVSRGCYALSPFPEAELIARYLKEHTSPDDRIAILGSEPEIFFYADRPSATRHIYMYGLMENHPYAAQMQQEMIREIETAKPKYIVMVNIVSSWFAFRPSISTIIDWGEKYAREKYVVAGIIDIMDYDTTRVLWDENIKGYKPEAVDFLTVLKRKEGF